MKNEWSLIFFTLLMQMSVGAFVLLEILTLSTNYISTDFAIRYLSVLVAFLTIALISSFLHLGNPLNAINSINNWKKSWLSKEIIFVVLFMLILTINLISHVIGWSQGSFFLLTSILGVVIGISVVYSMSKLYMLRTIPVWNGFNTYLQFFSSSIILGLVYLFILVLFAADEQFIQSLNLRWVYSVILLFTFVSKVSYLMKINSLKNGNITEKSSYTKIVSNSRAVFYFSLILSAITISAIFVQLLSVDFLPASAIIICTFLIVLEFSKRYLFYVGYKRIGV